MEVTVTFCAKSQSRCALAKETERRLHSFSPEYLLAFNHGAISRSIL
jgi:hypothetical protein